jgi:hypothetical protein
MADVFKKEIPDAETWVAPGDTAQKDVPEIFIPPTTKADVTKDQLAKIKAKSDKAKELAEVVAPKKIAPRAYYTGRSSWWERTVKQAGKWIAGAGAAVTLGTATQSEAAPLSPAAQAMLKSHSSSEKAKRDSEFKKFANQEEEPRAVASVHKESPQTEEKTLSPAMKALLKRRAQSAQVKEGLGLVAPKIPATGKKSHIEIGDIDLSPKPKVHTKNRTQRKNEKMANKNRLSHKGGKHNPHELALPDLEASAQPEFQYNKNDKKVSWVFDRFSNNIRGTLRELGFSPTSNVEVKSSKINLKTKIELIFVDGTKTVTASSADNSKEKAFFTALNKFTDTESTDVQFTDSKRNSVELGSETSEDLASVESEIVPNIELVSNKDIPISITDKVDIGGESIEVGINGTIKFSKEGNTSKVNRDLQASGFNARLMSKRFVNKIDNNYFSSKEFDTMMARLLDLYMAGNILSRAVVSSQEYNHFKDVFKYGVEKFEEKFDKKLKSDFPGMAMIRNTRIAKLDKNK